VGHADSTAPVNTSIFVITNNYATSSNSQSRGRCVGWRVAGIADSNAGVERVDDAGTTANGASQSTGIVINIAS
jgi:hypothetical protein